MVLLEHPEHLDDLGVKEIPMWYWKSRCNRQWLCVWSLKFIHSPSQAVKKSSLNFVSLQYGPLEPIEA